MTTPKTSENNLECSSITNCSCACWLSFHWVKFDFLILLRLGSLTDHNYRKTCISLNLVNLQGHKNIRLIEPPVTQTHLEHDLIINERIGCEYFLLSSKSETSNSFAKRITHRHTDHEHCALMWVQEHLLQCIHTRILYF